MRVATLLVGPVVAVVLGAAQQARAQAAVAYGMASASSATSSVGVSKVYSGVHKSIGGGKAGGRAAVVRNAQPAGSVVRSRGARRSVAAGQSRQSTSVQGTGVRAVSGGMTVIGEQRKEARPQE